MNITDKQLTAMIALNARGGTIDQDEALGMALDLQTLLVAARAVVGALMGRVSVTSDEIFMEKLEALRAALAGEGYET